MLLLLIFDSKIKSHLSNLCTSVIFKYNTNFSKTMELGSYDMKANNRFIL